jgi:iron complex outermembrane receptor protein
MMRPCALLLVLCAIAISPAAAQTPAGGQLRGRVVDQSGLVMPGADVALSNEASPDTRRAVTDTEGRFVFLNVPAGTYALTVTFPGLRRTHAAGITLAAGDNRTLDDLVLTLEGLEESVMVTARRREENLQEVPLSVSVLSGETLRELGVRDLRGVAFATPNMEFSYAGNGSGGGNFAQIFLRGVGQPDFIITKDPGVGVYVDNVYFARAPGSVLELLDVERIEILRGPQGTLFGKNTIGGAIQVVTRRPTGQFGGEAQLGVGRFGRIDGSASLDFPIVSGKLAGRIAGLTRTQDGFYSRLAYSEGNPNQFGADVSRENGNDTGRQAGRLALLFTPSPTFEVQLSADLVNERQEPTEYQAVALTTPPNIELYQRVVGTPRGLQPYASFVPTEPWTTYSTWSGYNNSDIWGSSMTLTWNGGPLSVKTITAYRDLFVQTKGDADATPHDVVAPGGVDINQHQFSQEVQLSGSSFNNRFAWVGGLWYFDETARDIQRSRMLAGLYDALAAAPFQSIAPGGNPNAACPAANCLGGGLANANDRAIARLSRTGQRLMENDSFAVFAHGTFAITPRWSVTFGGRQSHEAKAFTYSEIYPLLPVPYDDPGPNIANDNPSFPQTTLTDEWNTFTPKVGVEFKPSADMLLYVQGSTGFKAGGFNGRPSPLTGLAPFEPERLQTIEGGIKSDWFSQRLRANASVFFSKYKDIQISRLSQLVAGVRVEENAGDGRMNGFELELAAAPATGLTLSAGVGYLDFKYTSLLPGVVPPAPAATGSINLDSELPFSPSFTFNGAATYAAALRDVAYFSVRMDYRYSDEYFIDPDNSPATSQPAYSLVNARVAVMPRNGKTEFFVQGTNLTNEAIVANGVTSGPNGSQIVSYKPPRQWLLGVHFRF